MTKLEQVGAISDLKNIAQSSCYRTWMGMIRRVHSNVFTSKASGYNNTTIHPNWYTLSEFKKWYDLHNPSNLLVMDKDLLLQNMYSPSSTIFVSTQFNIALKRSKVLGVRKAGHKFISHLRRNQIETYSPVGSIEECQEWYKLNKATHLRELAALEPNPRIRVLVENYIDCYYK